MQIGIRQYSNERSNNDGKDKDDKENDKEKDEAGRDTEASGVSGEQSEPTKGSPGAVVVQGTYSLLFRV